eukprot:1916098-Pyramimonas_sp.AAC.1
MHVVSVVGAPRPGVSCSGPSLCDSFGPLAERLTHRGGAPTTLTRRGDPNDSHQEDREGIAMTRGKGEKPSPLFGSHTH